MIIHRTVFLRDGQKGKETMAMIANSVFVEEVRSVKKTAYGTAYLILGNMHDCEDAMGEAIVRAYENRGGLKKRDSFRAWFLRILRNECYNILRRRRRVFETDELPEDPSDQQDPTLAMDLSDAVMRLPESQRNALYLRQEGYSVEEIAQIMDVPGGTVKSRISRAREALRTMLEGE